MSDRPEIPVVPLRQAAEVLGVSVRAAESALRNAGIKSGYPLDLVEWLRDNRPGQGSRTDMSKRYEVNLVNGAGRIVSTRHFGGDALEEARTYQREHVYRDSAASGWTITTDRHGAESERPGLH